ncbi:hypothetical protein E2P60_03670 [Candidatus Bathyarchaeota archaeon]|nr:hypothetical protein E2P60_03670 [Candidatus Bathyarchaeota archaeon]
MKERYKEYLMGFINEYLKTCIAKNLMKYLTSNSNLPGPRGNLELADVFADLVMDYGGREHVKMWSLCLQLSQFSLIEAPVNNPREFLVFCGARGVGALGASPRFFQKAMSRLRELAGDTRWRTREGVAMAIQSMIEKQPQKTLKEIEEWIKSDDWLAMRAVAAGVAEPALLKDARIAKSALELHKQIISKIAATKDRKSSNFKILKKGLGYSLSVIVCAVPREGFEYMRQLAEKQDVDILWIVKENLKKKRLLKKFPEEIASIKNLLN